MLAQEADADPRVGPHLEALAAPAGRAVGRLASTGLSRSRNAALDAARGEILLVADDDVTHPPGAFEAIRGFFAENPGVDLCAGQSLDADGRPRKRPPARPRRLTRLNCARISSHELAFRLAPVRAKGLRFDEGFGAGAGTESFLGEEFVFVADCLKAGLEGRAVPFVVSRHPATSSGFVWQGAAAARARAAVLARVFGRAAPLARARLRAQAPPPLRPRRPLALPEGLIRLIAGVPRIVQIIRKELPYRAELRDLSAPGSQQRLPGLGVRAPPSGTAASFPRRP